MDDYHKQYWVRKARKKTWSIIFPFLQSTEPDKTNRYLWYFMYLKKIDAFSETNFINPFGHGTGFAGSSLQKQGQHTCALGRESSES